MEAPLRTPSCKIDTNVFPQQPTFSVYIHESWTLGKPYGIKLRCHWKLLREQIGNLGNLKRTWWEHIGNKEEKQKKTPPAPPPKGRKRAHHEYILSLPIGYMKFLFPKLFVTIAVYTWARTSDSNLPYLMWTL